MVNWGSGVGGGKWMDLRDFMINEILGQGEKGGIEFLTCMYKSISSGIIP